MPSLAWEQRPELRRPVLVAGFEGWNDAASAASEAAGWLTRQFGATKMASMDPEEHFDFQSARPTVELVDGVTRDLTWPAKPDVRWSSPWARSSPTSRIPGRYA